MTMLVSKVVLLSMISLSESQVLPFQYLAWTQELEVNGSSPTGHCNDSMIRKNNITQFYLVNCSQPSTSVLFDKNIPTLNELNESMWAMENIDMVGITMFNCPQWGIGVSSITFNSNHPSTSLSTSCNSLVTVCIPCSNCNTTSQAVLRMFFSFAPGAEWVHIAEVTFYTTNSTNNCTPGIITTPPLPTPPLVTTLSASSPPQSSTATVLPTPPQGTTITTSTLITSTTATMPTLPSGTPSATTPTPTLFPPVTIPSPPPVATPPDIITTPSSEETTMASRSNALPTTLSAAILPVLIILVCVVAALLLLWRCYCAKHHKRALGKRIHTPLHSVQMGQTNVPQDKEEDEDTDGYAIVKHLPTHSSKPHSPEDKKSRDDQLERHYSALTTPDPQSLYTQTGNIKRKESSEVNKQCPGPEYAEIINPDPQSHVYTTVDNTSTAHTSKTNAVWSKEKRNQRLYEESVYTKISSQDPQSVYTQVERMQSLEMLSGAGQSGGEYAAITATDPQSVYTLVGDTHKK